MRLFRRRPAVPAEYSHLAVDDLEVLAALLGQGVDLTQPRHVVHLTYFTDGDAARGAGAELASCGWGVVTSLSDEGCGPECCDLDWNLEAEQQRTLSPPVVEQDARLFADLAARHGGVYGGWTASV